ncbi:MAG: hypothetical protein IPJ71_11220 [Bdellovibrionales bacterium]|nr:hypothetical protein [Bdellovibrionales bacterium]
MVELKQKLSERAAQARDVANRAKKELDRKILDLTSLRFEKIKSLLAEKQKRWETDGDVVYQLAEKVLKRAISIRESLVTPTKSDQDEKQKKETAQDVKVSKVGSSEEKQKLAQTSEKFEGRSGTSNKPAIKSKGESKKGNATGVKKKSKSVKK